MSNEINKAILAKRTDEGVVELIHPETTADQVKYTSQKTVKDRLDELSDINGDVIGGLETTTRKFAAIDAKFEEQDGVLDEINNILEATEQDIADKIAEVKQDIADAEQELRDDIIAVDNEATAERTRIEGIINTANTAIDAVKARVTQTETAIATHTSAIDSITQDIDDLEYDIETDFTNIRASLASTEDAIDARITATNQDISDLEDAVEAFKTSAGTTYATKKEREDGDALVMTKLTTEYTNTDNLAATYATQSLVSQTADEILDEVSQNYIDTATGNSYATKAALKVTADKLDLEASKIATVTEDLSDYITSNDAAVSAAQDAADNVLTKLTTEYTATADFSVAPNQIASTVAEAINTTKTYADGKVAQEVLDRNSAITQTSSQILQTVSETYVNSEDAASTYATQTALNQTKDAIELAASQTYTTKTDFNNLEIGGRNLIILAQMNDNNGDFINTNGVITDSTPTADNRGWQEQSTAQHVIVLSPGKYILSIYIDTPSTVSNAGYCIYNATADTAIKNANDITSSTFNTSGVKYSSFTLAEESTIFIVVKIYDGAYRIKLEKGTKATDWSPAPEESSADLSNALTSIAQTYETKADFIVAKNAIESTVSENLNTAKTYADGKVATEVTNRNSAITQKANEILQTVSETYVSSDDAASTYATQTALSQTASAIELSASQTYATITNFNNYQTTNDAAIASLQDAADTNAQDLADYILSNAQELEAIQSQIDGSITTWFYAVAPTASNAPAVDWTTTALKNNHLGDLYYDTTTGYCYRYQLDNNVYSWSKITDTDVSKALADAAKAQDTADNKRRVFVTTPTPPYDIGDLWVGGSTGDIKKCKTTKTSSQSYAAADWELASKYTDDSAVTALAASVVETYETKADFIVAKNAIESTVSENYTRATQYTDGQISTEVTNRNSAITQKANEILQTVSETYVNSEDAASTYATQTALSQTASAIELSASQTYTTQTDFSSFQTSNTAAIGAAQTAAQNYADNAVKNLEIGGRNLARNTGSPTDSDWVLTRSTISNNIVTLTPTTSAAYAKYNINYLTYGEYNGETLTLSFDAREIETGSYSLDQNINVFIGLQPTSRLNYAFSSSYELYKKIAINNLTTEWKRYSVSVKIPSELVTGNDSALIDTSYITFQFSKSASSCPVEVRKCKFEKGDKATDWTPAPEDTYTALSNALVNVAQTYETKADFLVAKDAIESTVSDNLNTAKSYADGKIAQEVIDRNAAIVQKAGEIELSASSTYTTKTEFNNLEIGGRNLLLNTLNLSNHYTSASSSEGTWTFTDNGNVATLTATTKSWPVIHLSGTVDAPYVTNMDLLGNSTIITSVEVKFSSDSAGSLYIMPIIYNSNKSRIWYPATSSDFMWTTLPTTWTKFTTGALSTDYTTWGGHDTSTDQTVAGFGALIYWWGTGTIYIRNPKMEVGNKATDWTPAPEDIDSEFISVKSSINILSGEISSEVIAREEVNNALSELSTRVTQNATDITTEIAAREANLAQLTEVIIGTQTEDTSSWTGVSNNITALTNGLHINYWLPHDGTSTSTTLNLTLANGTTTGAINCYYAGTTRLSTHFPANSMVGLTYRANITIGSNTYTGWWADAQYNTDNYDRNLWSNNITAAALLSGYSIIGGTASGFRTLASGVNINLEYPILYIDSSVSIKATKTTNKCYIAMPNVDLTYTKSGFSGTVGKQVYVYGTLNGNVLTIDENIFTCTVPNTEDNKVYIPIGILASTTVCYFNSAGNIPYAYKDGKFAPVAGNAQRMVDNEIEARSTIIREFAGGVLIAKVGQTIAALVNANGSFDVVGVTWSGKTPTITNTLYARYGTATIIKNSSGDYIQLSEGNITVSGTITGAAIQGGTVTGSTITGATIQGNNISGGTLDVGNSTKYIKWDGSNLSIKSDSLTIAGTNAATTTDVTNAQNAAAQDATNKASAAQTAAQNYADNAVANVEIGGRNLAYNTGNPTDSDWALTRSTVSNGILTITPTTSAAYAKYKISHILYGNNNDQTFTVSFDAREIESASGYGTGVISVYFGIQPASRLGYTLASAYDRYRSKPVSIIGEGWNRYSVSFNVPSEITTGQSSALTDDAIMSFEIYRAANTCPIEVKRCKLEKGNKATDWTPAPEDTLNSINESNNKIGQMSEVIMGTQASSTNAWTGTSNYINELTDGLTINYWLPYAGTSSGATLNLTLANGITTGAINCYYSGNTRLNNQYTAGNIIRLMYRVNANVNGNNYTGWWADANYDSNTYDRQWYNGSVTVGEAVSKGCLLVGTAAGTFVKLKASTAFDITKPLLYSDDDISNGSVSNYTYLSIPNVDLTNTKSGFTGTNHAIVYIVGTLSGTMFTPNSTLLTTTVPSSDDGLYYMMLGQMTSTTVCTLLQMHDIYKYHNGAFKSVTQIALEASVSAASANAAATAAQNTANANIKTVTTLFKLTNSTTLPTAPNAHVTENTDSVNKWTKKVPTWTSTYKYYYTCYEYQYGNDTYGWSAVVYDKERSEAMNTKYTLDGLSRIENGQVLIDGGNIYINDTFTTNLFAQDITATGTIRGVNLVGSDISGGTMRVGNETKYIEWDGSNLTIKSDSLDIGGVSAATTTDVTNASTAAQNYVDNAVANVEIGGRNLLLDSGSNYTSAAITDTSSSVYTPNVYLTDYGTSITDNTNDLFILSFEYEIIGTTTGGIYAQFTANQINPINSVNVVTTLSNDNLTGRYIRVFKLSSAQANTTAKRYVRARLYNGAEVGSSIRTWNWKLEKGTKATDWTPAPEDTTNAIAVVENATNQATEVIMGTQTGTKSGTWTGTSQYLTALTDGTTIMYWLPIPGDGSATLNLTLADGTTTGAINCYYGGTTRLNTQYAAGNIIRLTYLENANVDGTATTGWWSDANYNTNDNTYDRTKFNGNIKAGSTAIVKANIIVAGANNAGTYTHLKLGNAFDITYPILYANSAIAANATGSDNYIVIPFAVATTQNITLTAYKPVYIKGTLSGSNFTPVSTTPLTQTVPS